MTTKETKPRKEWTFYLALADDAKMVALSKSSLHQTTMRRKAFDLHGDFERITLVAVSPEGKHVHRDVVCPDPKHPSRLELGPEYE